MAPAQMRWDSSPNLPKEIISYIYIYMEPKKWGSRIVWIISLFPFSKGVMYSFQPLLRYNKGWSHIACPPPCGRWVGTWLLLGSRLRLQYVEHLNILRHPSWTGTWKEERIIFNRLVLLCNRIVCKTREMIQEKQTFAVWHSSYKTTVICKCNSQGSLPRRLRLPRHFATMWTMWHVTHVRLGLQVNPNGNESPIATKWRWKN